MRTCDENRLYNLLPAHIRKRDEASGGPLRSLMVLLGGQLEAVESDIDALYDNWFIETCDDWVVPYIGDLLGVLPLRPIAGGRGAQRAFVADTLSLRQAKGTLAAIEQVAFTVTGWRAHAVEFFQRLIQTQNLNHIRPANHGCIGLKDDEAASRVGGPFEKAAHTIEVRSISSCKGRYNIPNIGLFVWRLQSYYLGFQYDPGTGYRGGVMPCKASVGDGFYHFDPLGRSIPLLNRPVTERSAVSISTERNVPARLRRRLLFYELETVRNNTTPNSDYFSQSPVLSIRLDHKDLTTEKLLCCNLEEIDDGQGGKTWRRPSHQGEVMFDPKLGRLSVHPTDKEKPVEVAYVYGFPHDIGGGPYDRRLSLESWIEPFAEKKQNLFQIGVTRRKNEHTNSDSAGPIVGTLREAIRRWNTQANPKSHGIIAIMDSATYDESLNADADIIRLPAESRLAVIAAGWPARKEQGTTLRKRGVLRPQDRRPHVKDRIRVKAPFDGGQTPGSLVVDGLVIESGISVTKGDLGELQVRHCTLGVLANKMKTGIKVTMDNTRLSVILDHVISGELDMNSVHGNVIVNACILGQDRDPDSNPLTMPIVLKAPNADLEIKRCTLFGRVSGRTLEADNAIFVGALEITRRQEGCIRFSYVPQGSRTPKCYRCAPQLSLARMAEASGTELTDEDRAEVFSRIQPRFTSRASDDPGFAQLTRTCPPEISEGGENGAAMGAYHDLGEPFRMANLRDALDEHLPLGLEAGTIFIS